MKRLVILIVATLALLGAGAFFLIQDSSRAAPSDKSSFSYFVYQDPLPDLKATVYLPGSSIDWGVQNPYKTPDQSLIKSPQVFVKAAFQNINTPAIYGIVRVVYDLQGLDCYSVFTGLAQLDGLRLQTYSSTTSALIKNGKGYVFEYYQDQKKLIVGSRVVCDDKYGLELMVIAPDAKQNGPLIQMILQNSQLTIPGTPTGNG